MVKRRLQKIQSEASGQPLKALERKLNPDEGRGTRKGGT